LDPLRKEMPKIKETMAQGLAESPFEEDTQASLGKVIEIMLDEVATLDSMKFVLSLSKNEIIGRYTFAAQEDSALAKLLSTKTGGGEVPAAQYMESGGWMSMVVDWDMEGFMTYYKYFVGKLKGGFEGEFKELLERFDSLAADWIKAYGGQIAARYDLPSKASVMNFVQIGSTKVSPDEFSKMLADYMALTQEMMDNIELFGDMGLKYKFKVGKGKPIKGNPTHRLSVKVEVADPALFPGGFPYSEVSYHYAVTNGHYITASERKELGRLLRIVKKGKPVKNSLAETLPLKPGQMGRWSVDVGQYAEFVIGMTGMLDEKTMQDLVDGIRKLDLVPITGSMSLGSGRFSADVKIPLKTIKAGVDFFESQQKALAPPESRTEPDPPEEF
ncbi:MAG: hypothetical protein VCA36_10395, partial [Opitutales bacterium]